MQKNKILFVCHGNICRSPMAEAICKNKVKELGVSNLFEIDSAAVSNEEIGNNVYYKTQEVLNNHGIIHFNHYARKMTYDDYLYFDYIFIMDKSNEYYMQDIVKNDNFNKIKKLGSYLKSPKDIEDPWYSRKFEEVFKQLNEAIDNFLKEVLP